MNIKTKHNALAILRERKGVLLMAHRGNCTSHLVDNTLPALEYALQSGADVLEMDLFSSTDGELFLFHTGLEREFLREDADVTSMSSAEVRSRKLYNRLGERTDEGIAAFEDVLKLTKGRCILNLDRCDAIFGLVTEAVKKHGMQNQIFLKSVPTEENLSRMEAEAPDIMYFPIQRYTLDGLKEAEARNLNMVGIELTFDDEEMVSEERMRAWHERGYLLLTNSMNMTGRTLSAFHDDNLSISGSPEKGWGWLQNRGFDIIQTDYADKLAEYLRR